MTTGPWKTYVALGDSLTEGVGDPDARGSLRGWAHRLAGALEQRSEAFRFENLARLGVRTSHVREHQLPRAVAFEPDLVSVVTGMNDVLYPGLDGERLHRDLSHILSSLQRTGAFVFTACLPDTAPALRLLPSPVRSRIEARLQEVSDIVGDVAGATNTLCFDMSDLGVGFGLDICSVDGLHPNARGHLLMAQTVARRLSEYAGETNEVDDEADSWVASAVRHVTLVAARRAPTPEPVPAIAQGGSMKRTFPPRLRRRFTLRWLHACVDLPGWGELYVGVTLDDVMDDLVLGGRG